MNAEEKNNLPHRDDLPMEVVQEIEAHFAKTHPGYKVVFAGDAPQFGETTKDQEEALSALGESFLRSIAKGQCLDCEKSIFPDIGGEENYPPTKPVPGWHLYRDNSTKDPMFWVCDDCEIKADDANNENKTR